MQINEPVSSHLDSNGQAVRLLCYPRQDG